jgi:hypothetical protein
MTATVRCPVCGQAHAVETSVLALPYVTCHRAPRLPVLVLDPRDPRLATLVQQIAVAPYN